MKFKKEYFILVLIIVALSVYLAMRSKDQTHFVLPQPAKVESKKVNRLVITKSGDTIELNQKDDKWFVGPKSYPADSIKVKNMVKAVADFSITDLISESGQYERYDLTDTKKINVQAFIDNEKVRDFDLGKTAPTFQHTFTRLKDDPKVYQVRGSLNNTFDHTLDDLRDLAVLTFDKTKISAVTIQKGEISQTLTKKEMPPKQAEETSSDEKKAVEAENTEKADKKAKTAEKPEIQWQDAAGNPGDQPAIEKLLNDFSGYKCSSYLADNAADNLKSPIWTLTFTSEGKTQTFSVFEKQAPKATDFPAKSSDTPYAFKISKDKADTVESQINKLLGIEAKPEKESDADPK